MKKSINAWTVEDAAEFPELFQQVKEAGFDGVELTVDREDYSAHSLTLSTTPEELKEIGALSRQYGLPVVSIARYVQLCRMEEDTTQERYALLLEQRRTLLEQQRQIGETLDRLDK